MKKQIGVVMLAGALAMLGGTAMASSGALSAPKPKVLAVLVQVDAQGHVTKALPSLPLDPEFQRMLVKTLDGWITRPASIKGHPVTSQMIINVALQAKPRKDGDYDANFAYVSSLPSPYGAAAHWVWSSNGNQLALVSDSGTTNMAHWHPQPEERYSQSSFASSRTSQNMPSSASQPTAAGNASAGSGTTNSKH
ncbi:hypothetical protein B0E52_08305 [Rhodanobacter sp. C06]|uniref:hypothetical protein n=1 Tax=Rhodanobacter sp. C06 TaxID=1945854 RepID=UPI000986AD5C|nr:hypothetical protein [Rhodanobacter sp. C06]OOG44381.1 hypothetical protein B0E52_08305 [Rhodanobacter sp. C06]